MGWDPYVSVAKRREIAQRKIDKLRKQGMNIQGVEIEGRKIARTFWGQSWCKHLESFSDYSNRLSRGRTYVCNGSVCHLEISAGEIKAIVSGTSLYDVKIKITNLPKDKWLAVKERCSGKIGSLLELLQGKLSSSVMTVVTDRREGLFPQPSEIKLNCSCPDYADMCKHIAAVLYGVGARLDEKPDLLFLLRGVDHEELIDADAAIVTSVIGTKRGGRRIDDGDLADLFGIEMVAEESSSSGRAKAKPPQPISAPPAPVGSKQSNRKRDDFNVGIVDSSTKNPLKKQTSSAPITQNSKVSPRETPAIKPTAATVSPTETPTIKPKETAASAVDEQFQTSKSVRELRSRLDLSQNEFALLIGVTPQSVSTWEKKNGRLNLQQRTLMALNAAGKLTKKQAIRQLAKI